MVMKALYNGAERLLGGSRDNALITRDAGAAFEEAVDRGNVYAVANQSSVAGQAGLSATTPVLTLANPVGSGKEIVLWYAGCTADVVATTGPVTIGLAVGFNTNTAVTGTITAAIPRNMKTNLPEFPQGVKVFTAATLPAAPTLHSIFGFIAQAAVGVGQLAALGRWYNGAFKLAPGGNASIQSPTATNLATFYCEYIFEVRSL